MIIPTLKQGGAERVMSELANAFAHFRQVEVHLILLAKADDFYKVDKKVIVHRLMFENKGKFNKAVSELKTFVSLRSLLKKHRPMATLSFMEKYNSFTIMASSFLGLNIFVSDRSNPLKPVSKKLEFLRKQTYKRAAGIIAQTNLAKEILTAKTKNNNIKVIPNPIKEVKLFPQIASKNIIINVGRLVPEKGQKYLIEAFSRLQTTEWKLVILGEGDLRKELEEQVGRLGIRDRVYMPGAVKEIDNWLAKSSIFAFPSISEGFPNALVEAMAAGLPCVSFDCNSGPRDIIKNNENGVLIPEKDVKALISSLQNLIHDRDLRMRLGEKAIKVREQLSTNKIAQEYLDFIIKN